MNRSKRKKTEGAERRARESVCYLHVSPRPRHVPDVFHAQVSAAVGRVRFWDPDQFGKSDRDFFRDVRRVGYPSLLTGVREAAEAAPGDRDVEADVLWWGHERAKSIGNAILRQMQPGAVSFMPYADFEVVPEFSGFVVRFESVYRERTDRGSVYWHPRHRDVVVGGETLAPGFFRHAVTRLCDRVVFAPSDYMGFGAAHDFISGKSGRAVPVEFAGAMHLEMWAECMPAPFLSSCYPDLIRDRRGDRAYYFKVGYCPVVRMGRFLAATTLLLPGYRDTPEHVLLRQKFTGPDRRAVLHMAENQKAAFGRGTPEMLLVAWLHHHGAPQVRTFDEETC